jgi:hypothetical protein
VALFALGIAAPHLLQLERAAPGYAIAIWSCALALRALASLLVALVVILVVPHSKFLDAFSHSCLDTVIPLAGIRLELTGHGLGDAATLIPTVLMGTSLLIVVLGAARAARALGRLVAQQALGTGPHDSVIVGGAAVVLATAGLTRPRILVSAGALIELDDEELAAGLAHEQGHIARRHRFFLLFGEVCRGVARFMPGTNAAARALIFHLERDADRWALAQRHEPVALARAICKADSAFAVGPAYARLGGSCVQQRVAQLMRPAGAPATTGPMRALATGMVALTLSLTAWAPLTAAAGIATLAKDHPVHHCQD